MYPVCSMISEMETIQILSSRLREEDPENEWLRRQKGAEFEKALRAVEDARSAATMVTSLTFWPASGSRLIQN